MMVTFCKQGGTVVLCAHDTDFWHFQMCTPKFDIQTKLKSFLTNIIHIFQYLILYKMRHFKTLFGFIWSSTHQLSKLSDSKDGGAQWGKPAPVVSVWCSREVWLGGCRHSRLAADVPPPSCCRQVGEPPWSPCAEVPACTAAPPSSPQAARPAGTSAWLGVRSPPGCPAAQSASRWAGSSAPHRCSFHPQDSDSAACLHREEQTQPETLRRSPHRLTHRGPPPGSHPAQAWQDGVRVGGELSVASAGTESPKPQNPAASNQQRSLQEREHTFLHVPTAARFPRSDHTGCSNSRHACIRYQIRQWFISPWLTLLIRPNRQYFPGLKSNRTW